MFMNVSSTIYRSKRMKFIKQKPVNFTDRESAYFVYVVSVIFLLSNCRMSRGENSSNGDCNPDSR